MVYREESGRQKSESSSQNKIVSRKKIEIPVCTGIIKKDKEKVE